MIYLYNYHIINLMDCIHEHTVMVSKNAAYVRWNCCIPHSCTQQWGPDLPFLGKAATQSRWLALLLTKVGDVEANLGLTNTHLVCDVC